MGTIRRTARQAKGKAKEAIAEVLGDGKLREEAKAEQRRDDEQRKDQEAADKEPGSPNRIGNLNRLT